MSGRGARELRSRYQMDIRSRPCVKLHKERAPIESGIFKAYRAYKRNVCALCSHTLDVFKMKLIFPIYVCAVVNRSNDGLPQARSTKPNPEDASFATPLNIEIEHKNQVRGVKQGSSSHVACDLLMAEPDAATPEDRTVSSAYQLNEDYMIKMRSDYC